MEAVMIVLLLAVGFGYIAAFVMLVGKAMYFVFIGVSLGAWTVILIGLSFTDLPAGDGITYLDLLSGIAVGHAMPAAVNAIVMACVACVRWCIAGRKRMFATHGQLPGIGD